MGLPGMCGFVGEFMVVLSTWNFAGRPPAVGIVFAVLAALTVVITAAYILWTIQRVFMGAEPRLQELPRHELREVDCRDPAGGGAPVLLGVCAVPADYDWMEPSVTGLVERAGAALSDAH